MANVHLILLILAFVLALLASVNIGHPRVSLFAAAFASFVLAALVT